MKKYPTMLLTAALICGIHPAVAEEPEPFVIPLPPVPGAPDLELRLPAPPPLGALHNRLHEHIHDVVFAPLKLLAQVSPPATPALSVEPVTPVPGKPRASAKIAFEDDAFRWLNSSSRSGRSLVIPKDDMNPETLAATEED